VIARLAAVILGFSLALAACGGSNETVTNVVTETNVVTVTTAAPTANAHDYARFQMPSNNVGCGVDAGVLRCDILSGLKPEPTKPCELDWTGVVLAASGAAQPECAGDTVFDQSSPVLGYGETWSRGGLTCVSKQSGLECKNGSGHGFTLARESWSAS
jgi:Family of unknown function (DUF6636)